MTTKRLPAPLFALLWRLLVPLAAVSCAYFVNTIDPNRLDQDPTPYRARSQNLYCEKPSALQLVNDNKESQQAFHAFLQKQKGASFAFIDKAALWSLIQMNLRPDLASPTSKLQIFIKDAKGLNYFHFFSKEEGAFPYLSGLETLLQRYKSSYSLEQLAAIVDQRFPDVYTVGPGFEDFLERRQSGLEGNAILKKTYMRADETLREKERIPKYPLTKIVKLYRKNKKEVSREVTQSLFERRTADKSAVTARCNYDMRMYSNSVYLIHEDFIRSQLFGLSGPDGSFIASASQRLEKTEPVGDSIFFKGVSQTRSAAFCSFEFEEDSRDLWMVSSDSRDPGQHIFHLMEYGLESARDLETISEFVGFSRHLFLEDPTRLVFESNRSSKEQLERLLRLNLPVYNARKLGNLWAFYQDKNRKGFVIDERGDGTIMCTR